GAGGQEPGLLVGLQPTDAALRLALEANFGHDLQLFPLLIGHPQQVTERRQWSVDARCGQRALGARRRPGQPLGLVLADAAGRDVGQKSVGAESRLEMLERPTIFRQRALTRLRGQVALSRLRQRQPTCRWLWLLELQRELRQRVLSVLLAPFGLE